MPKNACKVGADGGGYKQGSLKSDGGRGRGGCNEKGMGSHMESAALNVKGHGGGGESRGEPEGTASADKAENARF